MPYDPTGLNAVFPIRSLQPGDFFIVPADHVVHTRHGTSTNVGRAVKRVRDSDAKAGVKRALHFGVLPEGHYLVLRLPDQFCFCSVQLPPAPYPKPRDMHLSRWNNDRILKAFGKNQVSYYV